MLGSLLSLFLESKVLESIAVLLAAGFLVFLCSQYLYMSDLAPSRGERREGMLWDCSEVGVWGSAMGMRVGLLRMRL